MHADVCEGAHRWQRVKHQHSSTITPTLMRWRIKSHLQLTINTRINNANDLFSQVREEEIMRHFNAALFSPPYLAAITVTSCV